jgi:hypothetical protein
MTPEVQNLVFGVLSGLVASTIFLLALFIGFCILFGFPKLRSTRKGSMVNKSLDELVGQDRYARYLPPDAPRGPADQLRTPELLEAGARKSS